MNTPGMKSGLALVLQAFIGLIGLGTLAFMLWEPHLEGRNAHATTLQIYFNDPFLAYVYIGSVPFFVALYRAFGLFGGVRRDGRFVPASIDAVRSIKRCAVTLLGFVAGAVIIILAFGDPDDRPAGVFMSFLVTLAASSVAIAAAWFARKLQRALDGAERLHA